MSGILKFAKIKYTPSFKPDKPNLKDRIPETQ